MRLLASDQAVDAVLEGAEGAQDAVGAENQAGGAGGFRSDAGVADPPGIGAPRALRLTAAALVGTLWIGQAAMDPDQKITERTREKALRLGTRLAAGV